MSFYDSIALLTNILLSSIFLISIIWFVRQSKIRKLEKRLGKYSVESINDIRESLFDIIIDIYRKWRDGINKTLYKLKYFKDYSKKYEKYIDKTKDINTDPMNFVSTKFICAFIILLLVIINDVLQYRPITYYQIIIGFVAGFFIPDVFLFSKNAIIKREMENDLLKAITIMNNSFKSGRSIVQTIKIVSDEIDGPLKEEFSKMYVDLNYGLGIEVVFERFSKRVKLEEVKYISTSLTILNKTGGNIVEVFTSIERTVFNNRKLREELKNLTSSAKMLYRVLAILPLVFIIVIYFLDPKYFFPLFNSTLGIIIIVIIGIIYISYIAIVKKVIRLKEY